MTSKVLSNPPREEHIAACGLFCSQCGRFAKGKCQGCQVQPAFSSCPVRSCCESKAITTCAECTDFASPRDYHECPKVWSFIPRVIAFFTGSDRPGALAMLRDQGKEAYIAHKRNTSKM